jgi:hypothetical protein
MQPDQSGGFGDVRDVVIASRKTAWQIGISAKHQHEALKHSRLSPRIDFGQQWFGHSCTSFFFSFASVDSAFPTSTKTTGKSNASHYRRFHHTVMLR